MSRIYPQAHPPISFYFRQSEADFLVTERGIAFSEKGNYIICHVKKTNLSTLEMLQILEKHTHCTNIGYAGLKDKYATTTQYLSFPLSFSKQLKSFSHPKITIMKTFLHANKISLGDLEGNHFFIRLKQVTPDAATKMEDVIETIRRKGVPNYFGYQRFGKDADHFQKCREVAHGETYIKDAKMQRLLTSAYQSYLFNDWLAQRIELSKAIDTLDSSHIVEQYGWSEEVLVQMRAQTGLFKVLPGDILFDTQSQKWINVTKLEEVKKGLKEQKLLPTGLIAGKKAWRAQALAQHFEEPFDDLHVDAKGERRPAWVYPKEIRYSYKPKESFFEIEFYLPKGSYATVVLENIANRNLGS